MRGCSTCRSVRVCAGVGVCTSAHMDESACARERECMRICTGVHARVSGNEGVCVSVRRNPQENDKNQTSLAKIFQYAVT